MAKYIFPIILTATSLSLLSGCVTQSFENNEPIVKNQANRDEMAATRVSLGLGYLGMGDMSQAKLNLEKAKAFSPNLVQVHTAFAHYYETVGEADLAIESFEQALSIQADSADTLNNYGVFLCRQGEVAAAEAQFLKAIAVPSYLLVAQSYENLASCYLQNDNFEKSEMYLNKAIFHSPNRSATLLQMVRLQYAMADYQEAKRFIQKFERNTQRFTANSLALSYKVYRKLGKRRTASNYANMLVKMYPQSWEGKQYLLNELAFIEADDLADKYKLTQKQKNKDLPSSTNKRVVKLSPKKASESPYTNSIKTSDLSLTSSTAKTAPVVATTILSTAAVATVAVNSTGSATTNMVAASKVAPQVTLKKTAIMTPVLTATEKSAQLSDSIHESNSTQPIPAKRDVPLPEALTLPVSPPVVSDVVVKEVEKPSEEDVFHTVNSGENLYTISVKYNVKINTLRQWNNIPEHNKIHIGDKLYVVDPLTVKNINDK